MAIIASFSGILVYNFRSSSSNATARNQSANIVSADIRRMQSMALAGSSYQGLPTCGFGVHYVDVRTYLLFARPYATPCDTGLYNAAGDRIIEQKQLSNTRLMIKSSFFDIFFAPPHPTTYIGGSSSSSQPPSVIEIVLQQGAGSGTGTKISVYTSGKIDTTN